MKFIYADCDCKLFNFEYADGTKTRNFINKMKAAEYVVMHKYLRTLFWGCHLNGKHVMAVKDHDLNPKKLIKNFYK